MASPVIMPKQGQSVESCIITEWHKKKGDKVEVGDLLFSYETDKASFEEEAAVSGILLETFFEEGDDVPCLLNVCVIGEEGESTAEFNPNIQASEDQSTETREKPAEEGMETQPVQTEATASAAVQLLQGAEVKVSPRARNLAQKVGVDYRYATPTGPHGRVIERDVKALQDTGVLFTPAAMGEHIKGEAGEALATGTGIGGRITVSDLYSGVDQTVPAEAMKPGEVLYEEVKLPNIRKTIARAMKNSLSTTAQLTLNASFDATEVLEFRKKLKAKKDELGLSNITLNDIIIYAVSRVILNHKDLNANLVDDKMRYFKDANIGVAVDTERGLIVPTLFGANRLSLNEISFAVKELANQAKTGSISPDHLKNGSFTITNLGSLGIESFTPVINPPQTGILGVNNIVQRVKEVNGEYKYYPAMGLSLTFDHCAIDGAPAARFLKDLISNLENFSIMLVR